MILQALYSYYQRKSQGENPVLPPFGYSVEKIAFALLLDREGRVVGEPIDLRQPDAKGKLIPRRMVVPHPGGKRTVVDTPYFLWDKTDYLLGCHRENGKDMESGARFKVSNWHHQQVLKEPFNFFTHWQWEAVTSWRQWEDIAEGNLVFKREGATGFLHEEEEMRQAWQSWLASRESVQQGQCLITGEIADLESVHLPIMGVPGAQTSGAAIVSFNQSAFTSYGKEKSLNAPISTVAAHGYTAALNQMLRTGSNQKVQIGDSTTLFWAERENPAESLIAQFFAPPLPPAKGKPVAEDDETTRKRIAAILAALADRGGWSGVVSDWDPAVRFFVLGLAPNAARLSVRFWFTDTLGVLLDRLRQHYQDLAIERDRPDTQPEFPPLWLLLRKIAMEGKGENIPPNLAGAVMLAILTGGPYPHALLQAVMIRIRAEHEIDYYRAALVKACLVRLARLANPSSPKETVTMSLDPERTDPPYRLGRLFAVLEHAQAGALGNPNATIRDRYFGTASANPRGVFPLLLRLNQHHLQKMRQEKPGWAVTTDRRIGEIMETMDNLPAHLSLEEQGLFVLGYYHQRNALYRKADSNDNQES